MTQGNISRSRDAVVGEPTTQSTPGQTEGFFLSLEGIDFTWKSPIARMLKKAYKRRGVRSLHLTRDPPYWLSPWDSFQYFFERGESLSTPSEALMLLSARVDNYLRIIKPALASGKLVIADRYVDSWFAYQSIRIKDYYNGNITTALETLIDLHMRLQEDSVLALPDLTVLIDDDPKAALERAKPDELKSKYDYLSIQQLVRENYKILERRFSQRIVTVEIAGRTLEEVYVDVLSCVDKRLQVASDEMYHQEQQREMTMANLSDFPVGSWVEATRMISWTLGEFDDCPFVAQAGSLGKIIRHHPKWGIQIEWDDDPFKHLPKRLQVEGRDNPPIRVVTDK